MTPIQLKESTVLARGAAFWDSVFEDDISGGSTGHVGTINNNVISNLYMPYGRSLGIYYDSNNLKGIVAHNKIVNLFLEIPYFQVHFVLMN